MKRITTNNHVKKTILCIILFFTFFSCNFNKSANFSTELQEGKMPITPRFLSLIQYIDSLGYLFDTSRYTPNDPYEAIEVDKYIVFEIEKERTIPFSSKGTNKENEIYDLLKDFDLRPLKKAQKVMLYFFKKIEPDIINGTKWYPDGIIEEWTFKNEADAKKAAKELIDSSLGVIYFNTGAFVCQKENNMYIFYSRASGFMYEPHKKFFNGFVTRNNIELYNIEMQ